MTSHVQFGLNHVCSFSEDILYFTLYNYAKTWSCRGDHLKLLVEKKKHTHYVKDHPMIIRV